MIPAVADWIVRASMAIGLLAQSGGAAPTSAPSDQPEPTLVRQYMHWGYNYQHYRHQVGTFFKGPYVSQTSYEFLVRLPLLKTKLKTTDRLPLVLMLHPRGGDFKQHDRSWPDHLIITPDDNTEGIGHSGWFGYHEMAPRAPKPQTIVVPYTHRRLLYYIRFAVARLNADPNRIWIMGGSMGGGGALLFALHHPEWALGAVADKPPIDMRALPTLRDMAEKTLGPMEMNLKVLGTNISAWEYTSVPCLLNNQPRSRLWLDIHHGRRDAVVPFEQYHTSLSPPARSFLQLFEEGAASGVFAWDMSAHERPDPIGPWQPVYQPMATGTLRMDRPTLVFFNPSVGHFGLPEGLGKWQPGQRPERAPRGMINAFCRWEGTDLVDRTDRFEVSLWLANDQGEWRPEGGSGIFYSVSPRGTHQFTLPPRCPFRWRVEPDGIGGKVASDAQGQLTIDRVPLKWGRNNAVRLCIEYDTPLPVVCISSPTHPTAVPRAVQTAIVRWTIGNSPPNDPLPVDRYRCWIAAQPDALAPADCETPRVERVFESLPAGRYYVMVQARLLNGRWGPVSSREINIDPLSSAQ